MEKQVDRFRFSARAGVGAVLKGLIRVYQMLASPLLGHNCRYLPSCSTYGMEAIERYGPVQGSWLATKRICRCHPWGGDGFDPVPPPQSSARAPENSSDHGSATVPSRG